MPWLRCSAWFAGAVLLSANPVLAQQPAAPVRVDALGDPLPAGALFRIGTRRLQLDREIQGVGVASDGKRVVAVTDGVLGIWDLPSGKEVLRRSLEFPERVPVTPVVAVAPDGQLLVVNTGAGALLLDAQTGQQRTCFGAEAADAVFAAAGKQLTVVQLDTRTVRRYDVVTGRFLPEWSFSPDPALREANGGRDVQFRLSRDGRWLAVLEATRRQQQLRIHDAASGAEVRRWPVDTPLRQLDFSADGRWLAAVSADAGNGGEVTARIWDTASGKELARWPLGGGLSTGRPALVFAPDGASVFATEAVGVVRWDARNGKRLQEYPDVGGPLAFAAGGKTLVGQGPIGALRLLDVATGKDVCPLPHAGRQLAVAPAGRLLAWADGGAIVLADTTTGRELRRWPAHDRFVGPLAFAPDGKTLASAGTDLRIRLWDMPDGREQRTLIRTGVNRLFFSPDGRQLVSSGPGDLCLWDCATGKRLRWWYGRGDAPVMAPDLSMLALPDRTARKLTLSEPIGGKELHTLTGFQSRLGYAAAVVDGYAMVSFPPQFAADGRLLLLGVIERKDEEFNAIHVWDTAASRRLAVLRGHEFMLAAVSVSPDNKLLAVLRTDGRLCLVHAANGKLARMLDGPAVWQPLLPTFTPDGRYLVSALPAPLAHPIQVWEVATGGEVARWDGQQDVQDLTVAADGRLLVTMSSDHTALAWDLAHLAATLQPVAASLWSELASTDARRGRRAVESLLAEPTAALRLLQEKLSPVPPADPQQVARWIGALGSDAFAERAEAEQALAGTAETAGPILQRALADTLPLEARRRVERLLANLHGPTLTPEQIRAIRAVQVLEELALPDAPRLLDRLARGAPEARLTTEARAALERRRK